MKNKLSHSAVSKFQSCPKAYQYHYIDKLRPLFQSAALLFGTAVDAAITTMMKGGDKKPEDVFAYFWRFQTVNGVDTYLPTYTQIVYANSDYDKELLTDEDISKLREKYEIEPPSMLDRIYAKKEEVGFKGLEEWEKEFFNHANWLCLYRKGLLMIKAVREKVLPNVVEVLGTQEYVKLENDSGDMVVGYADLVCKWKGREKPVVLDFKTSSIEYKTDSVLSSPQLTLYVHALHDKFNTRSAGFVVLQKQVKKNKTKRCSRCEKDGTGQRHKTCDAIIDKERCNGEWIVALDPEVYVQIIIDEIPEQTENIVLENYDYINQCIKTEIFPRNFGSCIMPWGRCAYYDKCYKDTNEGLVDMKEKK